METATMELDDIKTTWQSLNRQLEKHNTLNLQLLRDNRSEKMKRAFRWAVTGQSLQLLFGVLLTCVFAPFWLLVQPGNDGLSCPRGGTSSPSARREVL